MSRKSDMRNIPKQLFANVVLSSASAKEALNRLGYIAYYGGGRRDTLFSVAKDYGISTSHFKTQSDLASERAKKENANKVEEWLNGKNSGVISGWQLSLSKPVRLWLLNRAGNKCEECGWDKVNAFTGKRPLQIHHKDGDASNNRPENLLVLCPSCHSLTDNFGKRQRKSARIYRYAAKVTKA